MADVLIDKYRVKVVRQGTTPANPGNVTTDPQVPVNPPGSNPVLNQTIGVTINGLNIGGVKRLIETSDLLNIPLYWQYNVVSDSLDVDGIVENEGEINLI